MALRSKRSEEKGKPEACFRDTARASSVQIRPLHPKKRVGLLSKTFFVMRESEFGSPALKGYEPLGE